MQFLFVKFCFNTNENLHHFSIMHDNVQFNAILA